ncbi:hypothetical protein ACOSQ2_010221 [Xanthoceras sorbifolium]
MSSLSSQRRHENRRNEASISCRQRVDLPRDGALGTIAVAQVTASQEYSPPRSSIHTNLNGSLVIYYRIIYLIRFK